MHEIDLADMNLLNQIEQGLIKERTLNDETWITSNKVSEELKRAMEQTKKAHAQERAQELALERKAFAEQEELLKREIELKNAMKKKQQEYLDFIESASKKTFGPLLQKGYKEDKRLQETEGRKFKKLLELDEERAKYAKEMEEDAIKELDKMMVEHKQKVVQEKEYDRKIASDIVKRTEQQLKEEQEKLKHEKQARITNQNELKKQIEEKAIKKVDDIGINDGLLQKVIGTI